MRNLRGGGGGFGNEEKDEEVLKLVYLLNASACGVLPVTGMSRSV